MFKVGRMEGLDSEILEIAILLRWHRNRLFASVNKVNYIVAITFQWRNPLAPTKGQTPS